MPEPVSTLIGAKILDALLGQSIGKAVDGVLASASKQLKDARAELDRETETRAAHMVATVQKAAEEIRPALEQIKLETGQDPSALFNHPPFWAQVAQALLMGARLDLPAVQALVAGLYPETLWPGLSRPLVLFFDRLNRLLEDDPQWGQALREFRVEAQVDNLNVTALRLAETAGQIAAALHALAGQLAGALDALLAEALEDREAVRLEAWEERYLCGLYHECNELPLAGDAPPDETQGRPAPRLQRVYVDLDVDQRPSWARVMSRLEVPANQQSEALKILSGLVPTEMRQRNLEDSLPDELMRSLTQELSEGRSLVHELRTKRLKALGIESEALEQALKPVTAFEALRDFKQIVLLGDPGSGKSTLTRRIAGMLSTVAIAGLDFPDRDWRGNLGHAFAEWCTPIRIPLNVWAKHLPDKSGGVANDLVEACLRVLREAGDVGDERLRTYLTDRLTAHPPQVALLLDGLDEVPDQKRREKLLAAVKDFCQTYPEAKLLVTCRVRPYEEDPTYRLDLPAFRLAPLSDECIAAFLQRWHDELVTARRYKPEAAADARRRLQGAIDDPQRTELREMAGTPLLLTMMARVNYDKGLPGSRAMLYESYVNQLLYEWEKAKQDDRGEQTDLEKLLKEAGLAIDDLNRVLNKLAYDVHGQRGGRDTVDIPKALVREAFEMLYLARHESQDADAAAWAVKVLAFVDARSGLLHAREQGALYRFAHRTFQEYLAARWIASSDYMQRIKQKIDDPNWREAVLLALGYQIFKQEQPDNALLVLHERMPDAVASEAERRRVLLLGEAYVRLLEPYRARQSAHERAANDVMDKMPVLLRQAMQTGPLDEAARHNVQATARQRLDAGLLLADLHPAAPAMDDFVAIPGAAWRIGRYPVTNREFRRFMDAGGYDQDKPWWPARVVADILDFERQHGPDRWPTTPRSWGDRRFNHPTQPVVGISWYEAVAYCAWLTGELQARGQAVEVRLPTLEEWRQAAGPARYPWRSDFDPACTNTAESGLNQTTPVDMYPDGATPEGVWDIVGNVWEWTETLSRDYPGEYVLVGGAWWADTLGKGSAARFGYHPGVGTQAAGFGY